MRLCYVDQFGVLLITALCGFLLLDGCVVWDVISIRGVTLFKKLRSAVGNWKH